ncbi:hypothetical protein NFJ02_13g12560 [Pycnococcus provasolii]
MPSTRSKAGGGGCGCGAAVAVLRAGVVDEVVQKRVRPHVLCASYCKSLDEMRRLRINWWQVLWVPARRLASFLGTCISTAAAVTATQLFTRTAFDSSMPCAASLHSTAMSAYPHPPSPTCMTPA